MVSIYLMVPWKEIDYDPDVPLANLTVVPEGADRTCGEKDFVESDFGQSTG